MGVSNGGSMSTRVYLDFIVLRRAKRAWLSHPLCVYLFVAFVHSLRAI